MDLDKAFIDINYIFNSIEHEEKSNSWKLDELRKVLKTIQKETYKRGIEIGLSESKKLLNDFNIDNVE